MRHRTLIIIILSLLLVGGAAAWKFLPHTLSYDERSDIYRHFADMRLPGVRVTYVQDKIINDTLRLPVTLLQAETDEGWAAIDSLFGLTADINKLINDTTIPDEVKEKFIKDAPASPTNAPIAKRPNDILPRWTCVPTMSPSISSMTCVASPSTKPAS